MSPPKKTNEEIKTITDHHVIANILAAQKNQDNHAFNKYFEILYDRYRPKIYTKCLFIVKDTNTALDLVQDIFMKIIAKADEIKPEKNFNGWVATITYHQCIDYIRLKKNFVEPKDDEDVFTNIADEETLNTDLTENMRIETLTICLKKLSSKDTLIIQMKYTENYTLQEIATMQKKGLSAIKMELSRARERLKKLYEKELKK